MELRDFKEFRCYGKNKKDRDCNVLLFKYKVTKNEMIIQVKCGQCNTFSILRLPFEKTDKK